MRPNRHFEFRSVDKKQPLVDLKKCRACRAKRGLGFWKLRSRRDLRERPPRETPLIAQVVRGVDGSLHRSVCSEKRTRLASVARSGVLDFPFHRTASSALHDAAADDVGDGFAAGLFALFAAALAGPAELHIA